MSETAAVREIHIADDHPAYAGHFPGMPILPGVILLAAALDELAKVRGGDAACFEIDAFKFFSPVRPGDPLGVEFVDLADGSARVTIRCAARIVAAGTVAVSKPRDAAS